MSVYYDIRHSMEAKKPISFTFGEFYREACAHTLGTKDGKQQVLVFQFGGESSSGLPDGGEWRCMPVASISNLQEIDGDWRTGMRKGNPQTCVDRVDLEVYA